MDITAGPIGAILFQMHGNFDGAQLLEYSEPNFKLIQVNGNLHCLSILEFNAESLNTDAVLKTRIQQVFIISSTPTPELIYKSFTLLAASLQAMISQAFKYHPTSLVVKLPSLEEIKSDIIVHISGGYGSL